MIHTTAGPIALLRSRLHGYRAFLCGSAVAAEAYGLEDAAKDLDVFVPSEAMLIAVTQELLNLGYSLHERSQRIWARWLNYGVNGWHTNSIRLDSPEGIETNIVYKTVGKKPLRSLSQVLESFDFGCLAMGYTLEDGVFRDLRPYMFPTYPDYSKLPLLPERHEAFTSGFVGQYQALRQFGRYARYHGYGHDMSLVKPALTEGYWSLSEFYSNHIKPELKPLGGIFETIAVYIEQDEFTLLTEAAEEIGFQDDLDKIVEALN